MRSSILTGILLLILEASLPAQTFTDSNLPIVMITTDGGVTIPDEPKVMAGMKIIYRGPGQRNYVTDQNNPAYLDYNGRIGIEIRGSSSQISPKKNYGFTTLLPDGISNNNVSLLGMPEENDWILGGMVFDTALIRDCLSHNLSRQMGNYSSRTSYCEVVINNDYSGLYILQEKIKTDDNRVDVIKITKNDNTLPALTGGYITKADKTTGGDPVAWTMYSWTGNPVYYIHDLPKPEDVTPQQTNYIKGEFFMLETTAMNGNASVVSGYPSLIDITSFIDYMIINEFASNADAYTYSTFFHKDMNGKLRAGPIWDLDLTYGNDLFIWGFDRSKTDVWQFQYGGNDGSRFWRDLFYNAQYRCYLSKRWNELIAPGMPLNLSTLEAFIDMTADSISEAAARDYQRWNKIGSLTQRIIALKSFIAERISWITANIGPYYACSDVSVPDLVITKIMYHPLPTAQYPDDDDLEFLEIRNNGNTTVNMSGFYFPGTGFIYQFPANSTIGPKASVILSSNSAAFLSRYGFAPFGQFTRHLSNSSENLVLTDGFGNVIDNVLYSDSVPWPDADGNGYYLKLKDVILDNNLPSSWTASNDIITAVEEFRAGSVLSIYPNPAGDFVTITSDSWLMSVSLYDLQGRLLMTKPGEGEKCEIDIRHLKKGAYLVRVSTSAGTYTEKIVKE
jgi:hypothetical protein